MSAFPSNPTNGQKFQRSDGQWFIYVSADNHWDKSTDPNLIAENVKAEVQIGNVTGTLSPGLGSIYITSYDIPLFLANQPTFLNSLSFCFNVGNKIYCPVCYVPTFGYYVSLLVFTTDSSALPVRYNGDGFGDALVSIYYDSGKIYFNYQGLSASYTYFDTSNNTWLGSFPTGSHTSGTHINSALVLNGFKYECDLKVGYDSRYCIYYLATPLCKVTKN